MKIIILTGSIGSGKTTVSSILKKLGAAIIDSDKVGHEVLDPGTPGWKEVVEAFGKEILGNDGKIDRKKLAQIVFHNSQALGRLNEITHPKITNIVESRLQKLRVKGTEAVFIEMAIIGGAPWVEQADQVWVVKASKDVTLARLRGRGVSESEALSRMASQPSIEETVKRGLVIINNNGNLKDLESEVEKLWNSIHN